MWFAVPLFIAFEAIVVSVLKNAQDALQLLGVHVLVARPIMFLIAIVPVISFLSMCVRRQHDRCRSGWWLLVFLLLPNLLVFGANVIGNHMLVFVAYGLAVLILLAWLVDSFFLRGTNGSNIYGVDPVEHGVTHPPKVI